MKASLLAVLLAGSPAVSLAQAYYLDLSRQPLEVPGRTVAVEQVMDGRRPDEPIGYVYRGLSNGRPLAVSFRRGASAELTSLLQAQLPARPTDHPLVLCLRHLTVNERHTPNIETAEAYVCFDAYVRQPDGYHFVQSVAAHTSAKGPEVTPLHAGHVAKLLGYCLSQLSTSADWLSASTQPALTLSQLRTDVPVTQPRRVAPELLAPILRERPRRGVYQRFAQFLANRPDTSLTVQLDTVPPEVRSYQAWQRWQRVPWVRPRLTGGQGRAVAPGTIWGFSDGRTLFVRHEANFFPLTRQDTFFTTVGTAPLDKNYQRTASAAWAHIDFSGSVAPIAANTSDVPKGYAVDMRSGELAPYPGLYAPTRPDTAYVYVYRPTQAAGPTQVQVWLNGRAAGSLRPGDYLLLPWAYYDTLCHLCLTDGSQGSACQYLIPDVAQPNYLRVSFSADAPLWQWVPPRQGEADLNELDRLGK